EHRAPQPLPPLAPAPAAHGSALLRTRAPRSWLERLPGDSRAAFFPASLALAGIALEPLQFLPGGIRAVVRPACVARFLSLRALFSSLLRRCRAAAWRRDPFGRARHSVENPDARASRRLLRGRGRFGPRRCLLYGNPPHACRSPP